MNLDLIKRFEGCRLDAYPDPGTGGEPWTIGYGTTVYPDGSKVRPGDTITQEQAEEFLRHDASLKERLIRDLITVPVTDKQLEALTSFVYNVGIGAFQKSTLLRKLNAGDYQGAADEFPKWNKAGGRVLRGLVNRRAAERELFLQGTNMPLPAIAAAVLPSLVSAVPEIVKLFKDGKPVAERNEALVDKVVSIAVNATNAVNAQDAADKIASDPQAANVFKEAIQAQWFDLAEAGGGGIGGARQFNLQAASVAPWKQPVMIVTLLLLPLVYYTVHIVLTQLDGFSGELRAAIASSVVTGILGGILGFWMGQSFRPPTQRP